MNATRNDKVFQYDANRQLAKHTCFIMNKSEHIRGFQSAVRSKILTSQHLNKSTFLGARWEIPVKRMAGTGPVGGPYMVSMHQG